MSAVPVPLRPHMMPSALVRPAMLGEFSFAGAAPTPRFGDGWGLGEAIMRWSLGDHSDFTVTLPSGSLPDGDGRVIAVIVVAPYLAQNPQALQRLAVRVNGATVLETALSRPGRVSVTIPNDALGGPIAFEFDHPDACAPAAFGLGSDRRRLGFAFRDLQIWNVPRLPHSYQDAGALDNADPAEFMARFDSLGDNCEFGIAQRLSGCEPLGLLRFTATPLSALIDLLIHEFEGLGDPSTLSFDLRGDRPEYILTENRYGLTYHTFSYADEMSEEQVRRRETGKLTLMRRRTLDELRTGRRIYTIKYNTGLREEDVWALFLLLRRFGPNRLLYVEQATGDHRPGTIELLTDGFARAYIDRFAPYENAALVSLNYWQRICRKADSILRENSV
ncbi:MAG: hypothetical protein PHI71_03950 [Acidiphilium sp.]|nr:hypothetical protein [Acidiphilium sp.]